MVEKNFISMYNTSIVELQEFTFFKLVPYYGSEVVSNFRRLDVTVCDYVFFDFILHRLVQAHE